LQLRKQDGESVSVDEGRQTDRSDEQFSKAESAMVASFELGSNVKLERQRQSLKHDSAIVTVEEGIQID
jgi:hypothetical protein